MQAFDEQHFTSELTSAFSAHGLSSLLSRDTVHTFYCLTERMLEANAQFNLTAITDPTDILYRHYLDCAYPAARLPKKARVIDVGCGAGFPSLPIAILRPDIDILAVDSTAKKVTYVAETAKALGLTNLHTQAGRAEELSHDPTMRESFDVATARAVADLRILTELCLPFVRIGGHMLAMKGKQAASELSSAKKAIAMLGGRAEPIEDVILRGHGEDMHHPLVTVKKVSKTPQAYPRAYAQISKKPL